MTLPAAISACTAALALAGLQRDGQAWAVVAWPCALPEDPTAAFAASRARRTLLWHAGEWLLGEGEAALVTCDGPGRGSHLAVAAARLECRTAIAVADGAGAPPPALPAFLTAFSFEDRPPGPGPWGRHLPGASLWLPRRLRWRRADGQGWTIAALRVGAADGSAAALADRLLAEPEPFAPGPAAPWPEPSRDYPEQVEDAVSLIRDGAMRKVVLARAVDEAVPAGTTPATVLATLRRQDAGDSTIYAHDNDDGGVFLGATPELLFSASGRRATTMALAGTVARGASDDNDAVAALIAGTKERKEHGVVVEHLVAVLRARCAPFPVPSAPRPRVLARIIHLETLLSADLHHPDYLELLAALQPTPAVCGLPSATAAHYIARHERLQRGLYAGALGWLTPDAARVVVPLRGGILAQGRARLFAGCGIIETSEPQEELAESEWKLAVMRRALGISAA